MGIRWRRGTAVVVTPCTTTATAAGHTRRLSNFKRSNDCADTLIRDHGSPVTVAVALTLFSSKTSAVHVSLAPPAYVTVNLHSDLAPLPAGSYCIVAHTATSLGSSVNSPTVPPVFSPNGVALLLLTFWMVNTEVPLPLIVAGFAEMENIPPFSASQPQAVVLSGSPIVLISTPVVPRSTSGTVRCRRCRDMYKRILVSCRFGMVVFGLRRVGWGGDLSCRGGEARSESRGCGCLDFEARRRRVCDARQVLAWACRSGGDCCLTGAVGQASASPLVVSGQVERRSVVPRSVAYSHATLRALRLLCWLILCRLVLRILRVRRALVDSIRHDSPNLQMLCYPPAASHAARGEGRYSGCAAPLWETQRRNLPSCGFARAGAGSGGVTSRS